MKPRMLLHLLSLASDKYPSDAQLTQREQEEHRLQWNKQLDSLHCEHDKEEDFVCPLVFCSHVGEDHVVDHQLNCKSDHCPFYGSF